LAEWCLRQKLLPQAGEQVSAAYAADSEEPRIAAVERRLREAVELPQPARHVAAKAPAHPNRRTGADHAQRASQRVERSPVPYSPCFSIAARQRLPRNRQIEL
jgi:hypothetical protein